MSVSEVDSEVLRLRALSRYDVLDTPAEEAFDRITRTAARVFDVPVSLVSLVDEDRQWFKSACGLDVRMTSREASFCAHAIARPEVMVVPDAQADPRFADSALVAGPPHVRFYAGAPLITPDGFRIGTLCLLDIVPRTFDDGQRELLRDMAAMVTDELELRRVVRAHDRVEARLRAERARYQSLVERSRDWIWETDADGVIRYASPAIVRLLGRTPDEVTGHPLANLLRGADADALEAAFATRAPFDALEVTFGVDVAVGVVAELAASPLQDASGRIVGWCGQAHDVSARHRAELALLGSLQQVRELDAFKGRFVSVVSHDVRTPLSAIRITTDLIEAFLQQGELDVLPDYLQRIRRSLAQVNALVEDVVALRRVEEGHFASEREVVDLADVVGRAVRELGDEARAVAIRQPARPVVVEADRRLLQLIVGNLLNDAIEHGPEDGVIDVDIQHREPGWATVVVHNPARGLSGDQLERLFEPGFLADSADGSGLALPLVKQALQLSGGRIAAEGDADSGATFTVELPLADGPPASDPEPSLLARV